MLLPLLALVVTGLWGLDFGRHWDEGRAFIEPLAHGVEHGTVLPARYNYPSVGHALGLSALLPELSRAWLFGARTEHGVTAELIYAVRGDAFLLRLRAVFLLVSSMGVVWVYLAVLLRSRSVLQALAAACFLGLSFEVAYHVRWVAPDGIMMQFGALTLLLSVLALEHGRRWRTWLRLAAVAAGLGLGSKYPGGLLLLPVLAACWSRASGADAARRARRFACLALESGALLFVTFLVTTPGALLEHDVFVRDVEFEMHHYGQHGHGPYTVEPGLSHAREILAYLSTEVFSPYTPVALLAFLLVPLGAVAAFRQRRAYGWILVAFPLAYAAYMSTTTVMIIRNLLVLVPFLAVLAAEGAAAVVARLRAPELRAAAATGALGLALLNAVHLQRAAESIAGRSLGRSVHDFVEHASAHPTTKFLVSTALALQLHELEPGARLPNLVTELAAGPEEVALLLDDCRDADAFEYPVRGVEWFGPQPVNYDFYPTWVGDGVDGIACRVILMPIETARRAGILGGGRPR